MEQTCATGGASGTGEASGASDTREACSADGSCRNMATAGQIDSMSASKRGGFVHFCTFL